MQDLFTATLAGAIIGAGVTGAVSWWAIRRHNRKVRAAERRARTAERLAELGSMTGGLAHEIKNPLSTIGLNAQLLAESVEELPGDEEQKGRITRRIGALRREVERLRGILNDFLEYAGEMRLDPRPGDLNALVEELVDFLLPQAEKQGVRLRSDLAPGPLGVEIDARVLKQAVLNLMLNALQAMAPAGGAERQSDGQNAAVPRDLILKTARTVDADRQNGVTLHVIDTGPGIEPANLARVFQPYFTTKSGGTGLGLPAARRIVEAHHGRLEVHTEPGRGSDFIVTLPALPEEHAGAPAGVAAG